MQYVKIALAAAIALSTPAWADPDKNESGHCRGDGPAPVRSLEAEREARKRHEELVRERRKHRRELRRERLEQYEELHRQAIEDAREYGRVWSRGGAARGELIPR